MRRNDVAAALVAFAATAAVIAGLAWWQMSPSAPSLPGPPVSMPIAAIAPLASSEAQGLPTLAPMLRRVMPAVVSVTVQALLPAADNPLYKDPFYRQFFGDRAPVERQVLAAGSGVVIDGDRGLILTNAHVIRNAERIGVAFSDGRRFEAKLVGADAATDLAVLKVRASDLTAMPLGNSDALEIGDYVVAIGNPFGLGQTATVGIVSALGRSGLGIEGYEDFIQTDAAVNPGNSGGALVDIGGRLVGINAAIVGPSGGNVGIGFAIPVDMARAVADELIRFGKIVHGQLGVTVLDHPAAMPVALQAQGPSGAMIAEVPAGSPAARVGLQRGDVIVAVDGKPVVSAAQLRARIGLMRPGRSAELVYLRGGRRSTVAVDVMARKP